MSTLKTLVVCAALSFAPAATAQTMADLTPGPGPNESGGTAVVDSIVVAEIDSLPAAVRKEVDAEIAKTSDTQLKSLRQSLAAVPAATSALSAKGKSVTDVVAAAIGQDGALLLVTTTEV